jgi:hypothetical protein
MNDVSGMQAGQGLCQPGSQPQAGRQIRSVVHQDGIERFRDNALVLYVMRGLKWDRHGGHTP